MGSYWSTLSKGRTLPNLHFKRITLVSLLRKKKSIGTEAGIERLVGNLM
jgi:hypothetical protein